ncbi:hypothetical protein EV182_000028 [Spiromyces aspiralis]|uniref:Uncharacterized protein n=1 Tax=Spiromyces aspiralis TaxID=68401 RepID=A0ACC1HIZ4_9FUNG|nr:hypothetical protein EV182_000028 [Spiromyces aspiralis]
MIAWSTHASASSRYVRQSELPRLLVPKLGYTLRQYLDSVCPFVDDDEGAITEPVVRESSKPSSGGVIAWKADADGVRHGPSVVYRVGDSQFQIQKVSMSENASLPGRVSPRSRPEAEPVSPTRAEGTNCIGDACCTLKPGSTVAARHAPRHLKFADASPRVLLHGAIAAVYKTAATRNSLQGRTEAIRAATPKVVKLLRAMGAPGLGSERRQELLQAASQNHQRISLLACIKFDFEAKILDVDKGSDVHKSQQRFDYNKAMAPSTANAEAHA